MENNYVSYNNQSAFVSQAVAWLEFNSWNKAFAASYVDQQIAAAGA